MDAACNVNVTARSTVCLNHSSEDGQKYLEVAISGTVCLVVLLLPTLIFETIYLCKRKSSLLLRLFFYATIAAIFVSGTYGAYLLDIIIKECWTLFLICFTRYFLYLELFLVLFINLTVLSITYHQIIGCCPLYTWTTRKWKKSSHPRRNEVILILVQFLLPLPLLVAELEATITNTQRYYVLYTITVYIYLPVIAIDLLLTVTCAVVLLASFIILIRKKTLSKRKMKLVYREMIFLVWFQVFVILWTTAELIDVSTIIRSCTEEENIIFRRALHLSYKH